MYGWAALFPANIYSDLLVSLGFVDKSGGQLLHSFCVSEREDYLDLQSETWDYREFIYIAVCSMLSPAWNAERGDFIHCRFRGVESSFARTMGQIHEWCSRSGWRQKGESWSRLSMPTLARQRQWDFSSLQDLPTLTEYRPFHRYPPLHFLFCSSVARHVFLV